MSARDYARVAYLILKQGAWDGRQVVPEAWLSRFATSPDYLNVRSNVDAYFGAGYPRDLVRIFGSGLNWAFVVPSLDLLAIRVGRATNSQFKAVQADFLRRLFAAVTGPYARPAGPFVKRLTLIDADTDRPVAGFDPLPCGARLDLGTLPTPRLNIRADTSPATVGSVGFRLDGTTVRLENGAPYALAGDDGGGDYYPWTPGGGLHVVSVTPYSGARGGGTAGPPLTVTFTVK